MLKRNILLALFMMSLILILSGCDGGNSINDTALIEQTLNGLESALNSFSDYNSEEDAGSEELNNAIDRVEEYIYTGQPGYWLWSNTLSYEFKEKSIALDGNTAIITLQYIEYKTIGNDYNWSTDFTLKKFNDTWKVNFEEFLDNRS